MEIIDYEIELINNLYDRHKLYNNNINHKNLNEYYIFNYIRYIKKTHELIKTKKLSKKTYNEKESDKQEPEKQKPNKQEPNKQEPNKQEPDEPEPDEPEPDEPEKKEPDEPEPDELEPDEPEPDEPEPEKKEPEPEKKEPEPEKKEPEKKESKPEPNKQQYKHIDIDYKDKYIIKIYKKCLMKCHPDKTKINFRNKLFLLLQKSYENEEFYIIILIANYLNININIQDKDTKVYDFFLNYIIHKYNVYK
jgi:hypothetical protein